MLYDPKWEVKADPFKLETLIAWLETQNPRTEYDYTNPQDCVLCRYFTAQGFKGVNVAQNLLWHEGAAGHTKFPEAMWNVAYCDRDPGTYGAVLKRARKISA